MRVCQSKVRIQDNTKVSRVTKCKLEDWRQRKERDRYQKSTKDRDKSRKPAPLSQKKREESGELDTASRYVQFTRPSLFAKVGLICETIDRGEERDSN